MIQEKTIIKTLLAFIVLTGSFVYPTLVNGLEVLPKTSFNIDSSLNKQSEDLNLPNSIIVSPITFPSDLLLQDSEWYEGLYYYMSAKLGQGDFLAHYIVTKEGQILQGNSIGDEQRFNFGETSEKPLVILYLAPADQSDFSFSAKDALAKLLIQLANNNAINPSKISLRGLSLNLKKNEAITIKTDVVGGLWEVSVKQIINDISPNYKPLLKNYSLAVTQIDLPKANVNYGDKVIATLTIKNTSDKVLYQGTDYEPIISKVQNQSSKFYINGTWLSQTQASLFPEKAFIKPGESKSFSIPLAVPLFFGALNENFQLISTTGKPYANTTFDMGFTVNHPTERVAEIQNTETGQLNVRDGPWASSKVITRVSPGQRFFVLEITETGLTKLDLGNGKVGWVVSKYTKLV